MRVLLLEDNRPISTAYQKILESHGSSVDIVSNVDDAEQLDNSKYDLFLIDILLPDKHGDNFIRHLRDIGIFTPVVVTTNLSTGLEIDEIRDLGVSEVVLKSHLGPEELIELVNKYA